MGKLTDSKNSYKLIAAGAVMLLIIGLIPLVAVGQYAHPCADDYTYGQYTHAIWDSTHSIWETLQWAFRQVEITYDTWQGTFSSVFLMALSPAVWGEGYYFLTPIIMLGMTVVSYFCLLYVILVKLLNAPKSIWCIISSIITFVAVETVPSPVNAFFWYNGAVHYTFMYGCMILLFACILCAEGSTGRFREVFLYIGACILAVACGGSNYSTALTGLLGLIFCIALKWILGQRRVWKLIPLVIYIFAFYKNITAYGNAIRQGNFTQSDPIRAVLDSFMECFRQSGQWLSIPLVLFMLLLIPFFWKAAGNTGFRFPAPVLVSVLSICAVACMFTPSFYAMSASGPDRLLNIVKMWFCLLLFLNEGYWIGFVKGKLQEKLHWQPQERLLVKPPKKLQEKLQEKLHWQPQERMLVKLPKKLQGKPPVKMPDVRLYAAGILLLIFVCFIVNTEDRLFNYTSYAAYVSLRSGEARAFEEEYRERLEALEGPEQTVVLKPYSVKPWLLYFDDIETNRYDWKNIAVARWYGKEQVILGE